MKRFFVLSFICAPCALIAAGVAIWIWSTWPSTVAPRAKEIEIELGDGVTMTLVHVPAGEFLMGTPDHYDERKFIRIEEKPQHRVAISKDFYLGKYEVTVRQFRRFVAETGWKKSPTKPENAPYTYREDKGNWSIDPTADWSNPRFPQADDHPVVCVTWRDAKDFGIWLSKKAANLCELPTEAEWEYACRAGTQTQFSFGDDLEAVVRFGNVADVSAKRVLPIPDMLDLKASDNFKFTAPVGQFQPNAWGLYDMHGNVREWCSDYFGRTFYQTSDRENPKGPDAGEERVCRGGSWQDVAYGCRSAIRSSAEPSGSAGYLGFRVCVRPDHKVEERK